MLYEDPKVICWCIWIERNQRIFQDTTQLAWKIAIKVNSLMGEIVSVLKIPHNKAKLTDKASNWIQSFNLSAEISLATKQLENWEIRIDKSQFENWMKEMKIFKLFFDGVSKGNPGRAGGGGVVIYPEGKIDLEYYWNIGRDSNSMAEAYGLWQGLKQLKDKGVGEAMVLGDSRIIIQAMNGESYFRNLRLVRLSNRIKSISKSFRQIKFFHILPEFGG